MDIGPEAEGCRWAVPIADPPSAVNLISSSGVYHWQSRVHFSRSTHLHAMVHGCFSYVRSQTEWGRKKEREREGKRILQEAWQKLLGSIRVRRLSGGG